MANGGVVFDRPNYDRVIELLGMDFVTSVAFLCDLSQDINIVESAEFELLRQGGCGTGSFQIAQKFADAGAPIPQVGQFVRVRYTSGGEPWYLGRVEEVTEDHPSGITVRTEGLISILNDTYLGGYGLAFGRLPHLYARSNYFPNDPDNAQQSWDTMTYFHSVVEQIYNQYILPTGIGLDVIEHPDEEIDFYSMVFRGSESAAEILRTLSETCYGASYGVNPRGEFFFKEKPETATHSFQEGQHITSMSRNTDRDLLYNYMELTGGYIYDSAGGNAPHYRFNSIWHRMNSIEANGLKRIQLYLPHIRNVQEASRFADNFFTKYGYPYTRYSVDLIPQGGIMFPWDTLIELRDINGDTLVTDIFENVKVTFDEAPFYTLTTGPDDLQYPTAPEPQNWEMPGPGGGDGGGIPQESYYFSSGYISHPTFPTTDAFTDGGGPGTEFTDGGGPGTEFTDGGGPGTEPGNSSGHLSTGEDPSSHNNFGCPRGTQPLEVNGPDGSCFIMCVPEDQIHPCDTESNGPGSSSASSADENGNCDCEAFTENLHGSSELAPDFVVGNGGGSIWEFALVGVLDFTDCDPSNISSAFCQIDCNDGTWTATAYYIINMNPPTYGTATVQVNSCSPIDLTVNITFDCTSGSVHVTE